MQKHPSKTIVFVFTNSIENKIGRVSNCISMAFLAKNWAVLPPLPALPSFEERVGFFIII